MRTGPRRQPAGRGRPRRVAERSEMQSRVSIAVTAQRRLALQALPAVFLDFRMRVSCVRQEGGREV